MSRRPRATVIVAFAVYVGLMLGVGLPFAWPVVSPVHMQVIAHSGDVANWPRDTMPGIIAAAASGADGIEFDVNRSADGTWWLVHDSDVTNDTTGTGSPWSLTDAELAALRIDGGMGFDPTRQARLEPLSKLDAVLDQLSGYAGVLIVDCKDMRPGAHGALATHLASRGLYTSVIARSAAAAAEIKSVDPRFRVIIERLATMDPNVDVWLADASYQLSPPGPTIGDLFGEIGMFVGDSRWGEDERPLLEEGRRWGMSFVITNDIAAALAWRAGHEPAHP